MLLLVILVSKSLLYSSYSWQCRTSKTQQGCVGLVPGGWLLPSSSSSSGDSGSDKPGSSAASTTSEELGDVEEEEVISGPRELQDRLLA